MSFPVPPDASWAVPVACFSLLWGVLSTLLWLWIVFRVVMALE